MDLRFDSADWQIFKYQLVRLINKTIEEDSKLLKL